MIRKKLSSSFAATLILVSIAVSQNKIQDQDSKQHHGVNPEALGDSISQELDTIISDQKCVQKILRDAMYMKNHE